MHGIVPSVPNYAVQPDSHSVLLFMVYAFHSDNVSSIWCTCVNMTCVRVKIIATNVPLSSVTGPHMHQVWKL